MTALATKSPAALAVELRAKLGSEDPAAVVIDALLGELAGLRRSLEAERAATNPLREQIESIARKLWELARRDGDAFARGVYGGLAMRLDNSLILHTRDRQEAR